MEAVLQRWIDRVRDAATRGQPIRLRGGGSKDGYGEGLAGEVFDTREYAGIVSYEPSELVVTVRCGTPLAELEAALAERGQCLPFEPPHRLPGAGPQGASAATCGGMLAAGLSGPARANAGAVRDFVLGTRIINGRSELLTFGGQVMKNVAGYDVSRLMAGSLGTLGIVAEMSLKVLPVAPAEATLRFDSRQAEAMARLHQWGGQPLPLNASCWSAGDALDEATDAPGILTLRLRGAVAAVDAACQRLGGERVDATQAATFWQARGDLQMPWPNAHEGRDLWRLSLPQTAPVLPLRSSTMVEWHGAQRWLLARAEDAAGVREAARTAGGSATLFVVGVSGRTPERRFFDAMPPAIDRIHRALKREFDPAGVFNPGRMSPDW
jgi:glycolate oxidase FAD binding subunit